MNFEFYLISGWLLYMPPPSNASEAGNPSEPACCLIVLQHHTKEVVPNVAIKSPSPPGSVDCYIFHFMLQCFAGAMRSGGGDVTDSCKNAARGRTKSKGGRARKQEWEERRQNEGGSGRAG